MLKREVGEFSFPEVHQKQWHLQQFVVKNVPQVFSFELYIIYFPFSCEIMLFFSVIDLIWWFPLIHDREPIQMNEEQFLWMLLCIISKLRTSYTVTPASALEDEWMKERVIHIYRTYK